MRRSIWLLPIVAMGLATILAGCAAGPLGAAKPTSTPTAQQILDHAKNAKIDDATFTMVLNSAFGGQTFDGNGNGKITKNPQRADIVLAMTGSGLTLNVEVITDGATNATYTKISGLDLPGFDPTKWTKTTNGSSSASPFDTSQFTDYAQLDNAKLVGTETVNGHATWHLTGTTTSSGETANEDLHIAQDTYYPVKAIITTTGTTATTATITFTGINTGISIDLPPADQVTSK